MIRRYYFFHFESQIIGEDGPGRFINVMTNHKSWLPAPNEAWKQAQGIVMKQWACSKDEVRCLTFNRV